MTAWPTRSTTFLPSGGERPSTPVQTLQVIKELLSSRGLSPRHSLGQNFLIDHNLIRKLVDAAGIGPGDLVLEVGPGTGALTEELLSRGAAVVACELDRGLAALLRERLADPRAALTAPATASFTLVEGDCLESKREVSRPLAAALGGRPFKLVANLPYGAATPLILSLLIGHPECSAMHITIQREVADRLGAAPSSKEYGPISIVAQALCTVERVANLPPECFWPRPEVTSAMVSLHRRKVPATIAAGRLAEFTQKMFSRRRKQLGSILGRGFPFPQGIKPENRIEELSVDQVVALAAAADSL
jgi:16S rRNA (adenine1518-N6/adenine1519-N6)-dimethyltransferase